MYTLRVEALLPQHMNYILDDYIGMEAAAERKGRKVGGKRYEARSRGRSSPDTLAF